MRNVRQWWEFRPAGPVVVDLVNVVLAGVTNSGEKVRLTNEVANTAWLVHRGVSQVKFSSPEARVAFWERKAIRDLPPGIEIFPDRIVVTPEGLAAMEAKNLVFMVNPQRPRVVTPKVIVKEGQFVTGL